MTKICPNHGGCRLVRTESVEPDKEKRENYLSEYCLTEDNWKNCRRFTIRKALWICPDFVLPDSDLTEDDVADRYEKGEK
jgi:hypothetical protein